MTSCFAGRRTGPSTPARTGSFLAGAALGVLPLIYPLAVHRDRFILETLQFHLTVVVDWYQTQGYGESLTLEHKLQSLSRQLFLRGNASILIIGALSALVVALGASRHPRRMFRWEPRTLALAGLFCGALVFATLAGPGMHAMYFAPVAALGALLVGCVYAAARPGIPPSLTAMLLIISLLPAAPAYRRYGALLVRSATLSQWTGIQTHRSAVRIAQMLAQRGYRATSRHCFPSPLSTRIGCFRNSLRDLSSFAARMPILLNKSRSCTGWGRPLSRLCSLSRHPRRSWLDSAPFASSGTRPWTLR